MPTSLKQILEQALVLSAEDRAKLAGTALRITAMACFRCRERGRKRSNNALLAFDRGEISAYSAEDVFADARRISR